MSGSYFEYKANTKKFLDWIDDASAAFLDLGKASSTTSSLAEILQRVSEITSTTPRSVPSTSSAASAAVADVLLDMPGALNAGQKAIAGRRKVHELFASAFPSSSTSSSIKKKGGGAANKDSGAAAAAAAAASAAASSSNAGHLHMIAVLSSCYRSLRRWRESLSTPSPSTLVPPPPPAGTSSRLKPPPSADVNPFDLLSEPEDLGDLVDDDSPLDLDLAGMEASFGLMSLAEAEAPYDDLKVRVVCFLLDLQAVHSQMSAAWDLVRLEELSLASASAMLTAGLRALSAVHAELQLFFPSLKTAADVLAVCGEHLPAGKAGGAAAFLRDKLLPMHRVLKDFANEMLSQNDFGTHFSWNRNGIKPTMGYSPPTRTTLIEQYETLPMTEEHIKNFFFSELTTLYNHFCKDEETNFSGHSNTKVFLKPYLDFFRSREHDMMLVLTSALWIQSIDVLQNSDSLTLGRTIYLARSKIEKFHRFCSFEQPILSAAKLRMAQLNVDPLESSDQLFKDLSYELYHHNPLFVGAVLLDLHVSNCMLSGHAGQNQILHLYHAMKTENVLGDGASRVSSIPFFESFFGIFGADAVFGKDPPSSRGEYYSRSLLGGHWNAESLALLKRGRTPTRNRAESRMPMRKIVPVGCSELKQIFFTDDFKDIIHPSLDITTVMKVVGAIATKEFIEKRIVSFHSVKFVRVMQSLCSRAVSKGLSIVETLPNKHRFQHEMLQVAATLCGRLLPGLDSALHESDPAFRSLCVSVGNEMVEFLKDVDIEAELFTFPNSTRERSNEFGTYSPPLPLPILFADGFFMQPICREFMQIMTDIEANSAGGIKALKQKIKRQPLFLLMIDDLREFPTILDHALSGAVKNLEFAEWCIQMKGLHVRTEEVRQLRRQRGILQLYIGLPYSGARSQSRSHLQLVCKHMTASDADNGIASLRLIMAASQMKDLEFTCEKDGNTALHDLFANRAIAADKTQGIFHGMIIYVGEQTERNRSGYCFNQLNRDGKLANGCLPVANVDTIDDWGDKVDRQKQISAKATVTQEAAALKEKLARRQQAKKEAADNAPKAVSAAQLEAAKRAEEELLSMMGTKDEKTSKGGKGGGAKGNSKADKKK